MTLPTFRVRTLMIAVAATGILAASTRPGYQALVHWQIAASNEQWEREYVKAANERRMVAGFCAWSYDGRPLTPDEVVSYRRRAQYYRELKWKHRRLMLCPWLPFKPDRPPDELTRAGRVTSAR
jgi:hypothetical protein